MTKEKNPQNQRTGISLFLGKRKPRASHIPTARLLLLHSLHRPAKQQNHDGATRYLPDLPTDSSEEADCHHGWMQTLFEAAGGSEGLRRLASAWHDRVMADDVVAHAFSHGLHPRHVERLAAYWTEALGGATTYSDSYGDETTVVKMHSGKRGAR